MHSRSQIASAFCVGLSPLDVDPGESWTASDDPDRARLGQGERERRRVCPCLLIDPPGRKVGNP
jgi:hypothetical protein